MEENTLKAVNQLMNILIDLYRQELTTNKVNSTGSLYNTIRSQIVNDNQLIAGDLILNDYWKYIEEGRKPGKFPNVQSIKSWIRQKSIIPKGDKLPNTEQLSFLISRKIARNGIQGKNLLERAIEILERQYNNIIEDSVTKDIEQTIDNQLKEI